MREECTVMVIVNNLGDSSIGRAGLFGGSIPSLPTMGYKVGDIVVYKGERAIVYKVLSRIPNSRCLIQLSLAKTVSDKPVQLWVSFLDIRLDKQYYRNIKLNKLGI